MRHRSPRPSSKSPRRNTQWLPRKCTNLAWTDLVYAALEYRIRTALKEHAATFPDQKGKRIQNPTARWVFHFFVGIHVLFIPGQWNPLVVNLTQEHQSLLRLLGKPYERLYR
jgi:hypothetical protein